MFQSPTPSTARRSARVNRSTASRGNNGSKTTSGRKKAQDVKPCKKWVKIYRAPAEGAAFRVPTWVPITDLTVEELVEYDQEQLKQKQQQEEEEQQQQQQQEQQFQQKRDDLAHKVENVKSVTNVPFTEKDEALHTVKDASTYSSSSSSSSSSGLAENNKQKTCAKENILSNTTTSTKMDSTTTTTTTTANTIVPLQNDKDIQKAQQ